MRYDIKYLSCDFETTVYDGQEKTEVWAAACVELFTEDVYIFHSISELFDYFKLLDCRIVAYFHNLKFDGAFWISYLLNDLQFKQAYQRIGESQYKFLDDKDMPQNSFKYSISEMGQWYTIKIKVNGHLIELRDSLKLLPFSVKKIGKSFGTKHKKLDMEYKGKRYAGCTITPEERQYIKNDVLVVKEALEIMFNEKHNKLTIGACCMQEFKNIYRLENVGRYDDTFPNLYEIELDESYGSKTAGDYIKKSYRGGWCYLVPQKANKIISNGLTADVNSLYPSVMSQESGNIYPIGKPIFWKGEPPIFLDWGKKRYYFIRIKTRFYLKPGYLPCIQVKGNMLYKSNEWLTTSDVYSKKTGKYYDKIKDLDGEIKPATVTLTLTRTDYELIKEHYYLVDLEVLDGCYFEYSRDDIFETYIQKYKAIKQNSTGAIRELAKLFLNNLYGKMASNTNSSFKVARTKEDGALSYITVQENEKTPGYIAIGSAITSYARNFTIRTAQKNYHGPDRPGFIYADTDSIHCNLKPEQLIDVPVSDTDFLKWKLEASWDIGYFVRQKTYCEHVVKENLKPCPSYYNLKCAGLNERGKKLFLYSIGDKATIDELNNYNKEHQIDFTEAEKHFLQTKRTLSDFTYGIEIPSKLRPKNIKGGVILEETTYKMR